MTNEELEAEMRKEPKDRKPETFGNLLNDALLLGVAAEAARLQALALESEPEPGREQNETTIKGT